MPCPLCGPLEAVEGPLITHLLREHPEAQAVAAIGLPVGTILLGRRPQQLVVFYMVVLALGLVVWASGSRPGRG
jgi:hypothetical protein